MLTEHEQRANDEARHAHRALIPPQVDYDLVKRADELQETPLDEHVNRALANMRGGYRLNLDSLLDCHSATYGSDVSREIARRFDEMADRIEADAKRIADLSAEVVEIDEAKRVMWDDLQAAQARIAELKAAANQARLALAGYVSAQSAINMLDAAIGETGQ